MAVFIFIVMLTCGAYAQRAVPPDSNLNFTEIARKYGQTAEEFDVITEDGYILKLFHVIGNASRKVLLVHGVLDSADGFIIRGDRSLAVRLARRGRDVWAANLRGNRYSRRHLALRPDADRAFWDYYVQDFGTADLPATIDFITARSPGRISVVCFSQGTAATFVLAAERPEYNDKIDIVVALAPIYLMYPTEPLVTDLIKVGPDINKGLRMVGSEEFAGFYSPAKSVIDAVCNVRGAGYVLCVASFLFQLAGADYATLEPDFVPVWVGHFPAGTSRKNLNHFVQCGNSKRFAKYDYGPKKNLALYRSRIPPEYDMGKVTTRVAILVGKNDRISTVAGAELLRKRLPNVVEFRVMDSELFNHVDFLWGKTTYTVVLPQVLEILEKYR